MNLATKSLPGWAAPWVGLAAAGGLGGYVAFLQSPGQTLPFKIWFTVGCAVLGFVIGVGFWLIERFLKP